MSSTVFLQIEQPPREPQNFLRKYIGFSDREISDLYRGRILVKILKTKEKREVAAFGIVKVNAPPEMYVECFRDIVTFKKSDAVSQIAKFSNPPDINDLHDLTLDADDLKSIKKCKVGNCSVKMPAHDIESFRTINWSSPDWKAKVEALYKQMLINYAMAYLNGGNSALSEYHDKKKPVRIADEFRAILEQSPYLYDYAPEFQKYLIDFPNMKLDGVENFIYWSKEKFGLKPVISLTHVTIYRRRQTERSTILISSKQIYASHYFDASLGLTALVHLPDTSGFYLMYLNRSRSDALKGNFSGLKRNIVESETSDGMQRNLKLTKLRVEALYAEANTPKN